jgi:hypothetical protein
MMWVDYTINSLPSGKGFTVQGDWPGEVMGKMADGKQKENYLYKPGDRFIVNENGWLIRCNPEDEAERAQEA